MKLAITTLRYYALCIFLIIFQLSVWSAETGIGTNGFGAAQSFFAGIPTNISTPPRKFPSASNLQAQISTADIDGDGRPDLAFFLNLGVSGSRTGDIAVIVLMRNSTTPGGL